MNSVSILCENLTQTLNNVVVHDATLPVEIAPFEQLDEALLVTQLVWGPEDVAVLQHLDLGIAACR